MYTYHSPPSLRHYVTRGLLPVMSSRPRTTRRAPHIYPDISGVGFQYHLSQLTVSDEWYCPQTMHPQDVGSTPGLSHSHCRVLTLPLVAMLGCGSGFPLPVCGRVRTLD